MKKYSRLALIAFFLILAPVLSSASSSPFFTGISFSKDSEALLLAATLENGMTWEITDMIQSGALTTFTYDIKLKRRRTGWFDKTEAKLIIKRETKYNLLKKMYSISEEIESSVFPEKMSVVGKAVTRKKNMVDFSEMVQWMTELQGVKLATSKSISRHSSYYIQVRADLKTINLWFPFNFILFFTSFWDVDTDLTTVAVVNSGGSLPSASVPVK